MHSTVVELENEGFPIRTIDVRYQAKRAAKYQIRGVPTFIYVRNGQEVRRHTGTLSLDELKRMFR